MPEQETPQVVIQGLNALNRIQKIVSKQIEFTYNDLDQADDLRQSFQIIQSELANYNNIVRQHQARQAQNQESEVVEETGPKPVDEDNG